VESLLAQKLDQAAALLDELGIDAWLTFVRETGDTGDPVLPLILGQHLTWQSALLLTRSNDRVAIVGKYDDGPVRATGVWTEIVAYVEGVGAPLREALKRFDPETVAINYSADDVMADGLSHGMYLLLREHLDGTPYRERLVSSADLVGALRGRKSAAELERICRAIATTEAILGGVPETARPGRTERDVARAVKEAVAAKGLGLAWEAEMCPIVNTGPDSMIGHGLPSDLVIEPGHVLHIDFGVKQDEYCSDLQRCWYVPEPGEASPPAEIQRAFDTVVRAIQAAAAALKPGTAGWEVDAAARKVVVDAGYPEYQHGTGHHVGRSAHDGSGILGPRWERYGRAPYREAESGNVFTLELGIENVAGRGYIGLEEMVIVTDDGCDYLSSPQTTLPLLR
jgi:Xaa-Pro aminopeptidase